VFKQGFAATAAAAASGRVRKVHRYEPWGRCTGSCGFGPSRKMTPHFLHAGPDHAEAVKVTELILAIYHDFGFDDVRIKFSDRPPKRLGSDEIWDNAESGAAPGAAAAGDRNPPKPRRRGLLRTEVGVRAAGCHRRTGSAALCRWTSISRCAWARSMSVRTAKSTRR